MAMVTVPGTVPDKFAFTVRDEAVAAEVNRLSGRRVSLRYEEKVAVPSSCFGETRYFVVGVRAIEDATPLPGPAQITPPATGTAAPVVSSAKGYAVARWTAGGMAYTAISDINPADLQEFARIWAMR